MKPTNELNAAPCKRNVEPSREAFTLTELLVVIATITLLFAMLFPALARTGSNSHVIQCMNNLRQMITGTLLYTGDHNDLFPPNPDDANSLFGHNWAQGNAGGSGNVSWRPEYLADERRSVILNYIGRDLSLFKCPADSRMGTPTVGQYAGQTIPAPRTISMNGAVGTVCPGFAGSAGHGGGAPKHETPAPHLGGQDFYRYNKISSISAPKPAGLWVFLDESPILLNDGAFGFTMTRPTWVDVPGNYHDGAGSFAFADGHVESKTWSSERTGKWVGAITPGTAEEKDYLWMRERTSAPK